MNTHRIDWVRNEKSKLKQKPEPMIRSGGMSHAADLPKKELKKNSGSKEKKA